MNEIGTNICNLCIEIMEIWANELGISYGLLNVLLFIVLQPLLILIFWGTTIYCSISKNEKIKRIIRISSIVTMIIISIGVFISIILPLGAYGHYDL